MHQRRNLSDGKRGVGENMSNKDKNSDGPENGTVGIYQLVSRLGAGGMGEVYLAHAPSGRRVAVKVVHSHLVEDPLFRARFRQEVAAARRVSGAFTAPVVDADPDAQPPWMATVYVPAPTLSRHIHDNGPMPVEELWQLFGGLAEALRDIHRAQVIHRDLKPSNVLITDDGPLVIDFGIAKAIGRNASEVHTKTGQVIGTPPFMAPEQWQVPPEISPATDVFALGSLLVYAATGRGPFDADHPYVTAYQIVHRDPNLSDLPDPLRPIIEKCLDKNPTRRPTPDELLTMVRSRRAAITAQDPTDQGAAGARHRRRSKRVLTRALISGIAAISLLAAGIPVALNWLHKSSERTTESGAGYNAATKGIAHPSKTKGGALRFVSTQEADSWDPQRTYYGFVWDFARYYTRQLVSFAPQPGRRSTTLVPDLAAGLAKVSDSGTTYTYALRDGITWEDGSPITSQDIKYGIERSWADDVISGGPAYLQKALDPKKVYKGPYNDKDPQKLGLRAIETPDERTIVFHLAEPNGDFEQMLALPTASPVKSERDTGSLYELRPFSSGPYKFASYDPNRKLVLVRNEQWSSNSDPIRSALPNRIEVTFVNDANDMDSRLLSGEFDLDLNGTGLSQAAVSKALGNSDLMENLDNPRTGYIRYAAFPKSVKPLDNIHCRKAVIFAADHKDLQTARGGSIGGGDIAPNMLPLSIAGSDRTFDPYGVLGGNGRSNLEKAKEELRACGKPNGFSTTMAVRKNTPAELNTAIALQKELRKVDINTTIDRIDGAATFGVFESPRAVKDRGYGIILMGFAADFPTGQGFLRPLVDGRFILEAGNNNYSELDDPEINALFDRAISERDPVKAGRIYQQINRKVSENAVYMPITYEKIMMWRGPRLVNAYTADSYYGRYDYVSLGVK
ncbi:ABC transporter substrate-binding protein [Streptomyces sp. NBC_01571]|uniref:ABC transporter substrate-binding protein n=1 Tax=Streptomyces sp. NBC_01571 TaxID=2975883 RepID=UPI002257175F|nr:ABC transporter substrate-binding protein [Streptomyces sp. NBC_01571]MCX4571717.1 ABC transporter substrate-binding protein [Streptomyces sp. NBC_01571]